MLKFKNPGIVPIIFIICATAVLLSLSAWQFKRLAWKEELLSQIETAMSAPAVTSITGDVGYHKALLTGAYINTPPLRFVGTKSNGYVYYVSFKLDDSDEIILINRGWFEAKDGPKIEPGIVTVEGILRPFHEKRRFAPENAPDKNIWFTENVAEIHATTGLTIAPYVLETGKIPPLRNDHLGYAITWLILAILGLVMFALYCKEKP